jgi:alcohol dehydrogenase
MNDRGPQPSTTMRAARLYAPGEKLRVETMPRPQVRPHDVIVEVKACGVIPNMNHVLSGPARLILPPLPAVVGLDAAGVISEVGANVTRFKPGDRVYINPLLSCGTCRQCRAGRDQICVDMTFRGYFGFTPGSERLQREYPWGGYSEYTLAPARNLVPLRDNVTFEQAARFGYLGSSYAALQQAQVRAGSWVLINGATGTLGVGAVLFALGMGASRILGLGRNRDLLAKIKALAPHRIDVLAGGDQPIAEWARACTDGYGPNAVVDCTTRSTPSTLLEQAFTSMQRGGIAVSVGGLAEKMSLTPNIVMNNEWQLRGSCWFATSDAEEMAELIGRGVVDLGSLECRRFALDDINAALDVVRDNPGGFTNVVVTPKTG